MIKMQNLQLTDRRFYIIREFYTELYKNNEALLKYQDKNEGLYIIPDIIMEEINNSLKDKKKQKISRRFHYHPTL